MLKVHRIMLIILMILCYFHLTHARLLRDNEATKRLDDKPKVSVPTEGLLVSASSQNEYEYRIDGIILNNSAKTDTDAVRVDLVVQFETGNLQLNEEYQSLADFENCTLRRFSDWKCRGNGRGKNMTFIAHPSNLDKVLSNLIFETYSSKTEDQIIVRVYYGEGADCLTAKEQINHAVYSRCIKTQGIVKIPALVDAKVASGAGISLEDSKLSWLDASTQFFLKNLHSVILGQCILIFTLVALCCYCRNRKRSKELAKDPAMSDLPMNL